MFLLILLNLDSKVLHTNHLFVFLSSKKYFKLFDVNNNIVHEWNKICVSSLFLILWDFEDLLKSPNASNCFADPYVLQPQGMPQWILTPYTVISALWLQYSIFPCHVFQLSLLHFIIFFNNIFLKFSCSEVNKDFTFHRWKYLQVRGKTLPPLCQFNLNVDDRHYFYNTFYHGNPHSVIVWIWYIFCKQDILMFTYKKVFLHFEF